MATICGVVALAFVLHMSGVSWRIALMAAIGTMTLAMVVALVRMRRKAKGGKAPPVRHG